MHVQILGSGNKIIIGNNVLINNNNNEIFMAGDGNTLIIDDGCNFSGDVHFILEQGKTIHIQKGCLFGMNVYLRTFDGHPIYDERGVRINSGKDIDIAQHVWVGQQVAIHRASIGKGSMIGMRSFVNKDFGENCMIVGTPAKVIRQGIHWQYNDNLPYNYGE